MSNKKSKPTVTFEVPSKAPDGNILLIKILLQMKIDSKKLQTRDITKIAELKAFQYNYLHKWQSTLGTT